jgi:hypothetical protein
MRCRCDKAARQDKKNMDARVRYAERIQFFVPGF